MVKMIKYSATGRRKTSVARVDLIPGKGRIKINHRSLELYFPREVDRLIALEPLKVTNCLGKFDVEAKIVGGGLSGQSGALRLGLARALVFCDDKNRPILKKNEMLTRDPRMKERKKPGQKGARKKFQWVKR